MLNELFITINMNFIISFIVSIVYAYLINKFFQYFGSCSTLPEAYLIIIIGGLLILWRAINMGILQINYTAILFGVIIYAIIKILIYLINIIIENIQSEENV